MVRIGEISEAILRIEKKKKNYKGMENVEILRKKFWSKKDLAFFWKFHTSDFFLIEFGRKEKTWKNSEKLILASGY